MTETVNLATGEIATVDTSSEVAVTSYLQHARDWLATAVESTGPEQIAAAKAEIATAAEATKQLHLSKEIQDDAKEMVRRAEYALRKAQLKAQSVGEMRDRGGDHRSSGAVSLPSPRDYFSTEVEYRDSLALGALADAEFEAVIADARAEGNLSRQNVANKARELTGPKQHHPSRPAERKHQEAELINAFRVLLRNLTPKNISTLSPRARGHLVAILSDTITKLEEGQS